MVVKGLDVLVALVLRWTDRVLVDGSERHRLLWFLNHI